MEGKCLSNQIVIHWLERNMIKKEATCVIELKDWIKWANIHMYRDICVSCASDYVINVDLFFVYEMFVLIYYELILLLLNFCYIFHFHFYLEFFFTQNLSFFPTKSFWKEKIMYYILHKHKQIDMHHWGGLQLAFSGV